MDGLVSLLKDAFGYTLPIALLWPAISIIKGVVNGIEGAGDLVRNVGNSQFGRKRLEAERDALKNKKQAAAYNNIPTTRTGRVLDVITGKASIRNRRRRDLRYQDAEMGAKAGEAGFGVADPKAAALMQSIADSQRDISAANAASTAKGVRSLAQNPAGGGGSLGAAASDPDVRSALDAQQARAVAEEIKNAQLKAEVEFPPNQLDKVREAMEEAIRGGDSIKARAYQNVLLNSGSEGIKQFREGMGKVSPTGEMEENLKRNILTSHAGIKDTAADIGEYATSAPGETLAQMGQRADTWTMADAKLVTQKGHSLEMAKNASAISKEQAQRIKDDAQLYGKLDEKGRGIIDSLI